jgi:RNA polymerase sigma-70 factor (ECF subfamily)
MVKPIPQPDFSLPSLQARDRVEFARLVDFFSTPIYRLALRMLGDPQDAEDVLQETFIKTYKALPSFEGRSSLSTWLYRIAVNEALMQLRQRRPGQVSIDEDLETEDGEREPVQIIDWKALPEDELLSSETRKLLDHAIQRLPVTLRSVFILRDIEGLSVRETAEALEVNEAVVKTRLLRARLWLREQLSAYFTERKMEK